MEIPKIDFSPLYNAISFRGSAKKSKYLPEKYRLQEQGFSLEQRGLSEKNILLNKQQDLLTLETISAGLSVASNVLNMGAQIYGIFESNAAEEAKAVANAQQSKIDMLAKEAMFNGDFSTLTREDGSQAIIVGGKYKNAVAEIKAEYSDKWGNFGKVQTWFDSAIDQMGAAGELSVFNYGIQQSVEARESFWTGNMEDSLKRAIAEENPQHIGNQLSAAAWHPKWVTEQYKADYMRRYIDGVDEKNIRAIADAEGEPAALAYVDERGRGEGWAEDRFAYFRTVASNQGKASDGVYNEKIATAVEPLQQQGATIDQQIAAVRALNIPAGRKQDAIDVMTFGKETQDITGITTTQSAETAYQVAMSWYGPNGKKGEDPVRLEKLNQTIGQVEAQESKYWENYVNTQFKDIVETKGGTVATARERIMSKVSAGYKDEAADILDKRQALYATRVTMDEMNQWDVRDSVPALQELYDKTKIDARNLYEGLSDGTQKTQDLNAIEARIKRLSAETTGSGAGQSVDSVIDGIAEMYMRGEIDYYAARTMMDNRLQDDPTAVRRGWGVLSSKVPKRWENTMTTLNKDLEAMINKVDKNFIKNNPDKINSVINHANEMILDAIHDNKDITSTEIDSLKTKATDYIYSKTWDLSTKQYGQTGVMSLDQRNELQRLKDQGLYDALIYEDAEGNVNYPAFSESNFNELHNYQKDLVEQYTGQKAKLSLQREGADDVTAKAQFMTDGGTYTFKAGDKGLSLYKENVKQDGNVALEKIAEQDKTGKLIPYVTPDQQKAIDEAARKKREEEDKKARELTEKARKEAQQKYPGIIK